MTETRLSRSAWWLYLALMLPIAVLYLAGRSTPGRSSI